jgi:hypothetical protein
MLKHISLIVRHETEIPKRIGEAMEELFRRRGVSVTEGQVDPQAEAIVVLGTGPGFPDIRNSRAGQASNALGYGKSI